MEKNEKPQPDLSTTVAELMKAMAAQSAAMAGLNAQIEQLTKLVGQHEERLNALSRVIG